MPPKPARSSPGGPGTSTERAEAFIAERRDLAVALGRGLAEHLQDTEELRVRLRAALAALADPAYLAGQQFVAPDIGPTLGVRTPLLTALRKGFRGATRNDSPTALLLAADRLLREPVLEARWFAFGILDVTLARETERSWQLLRRAGREAADWITVDSLAHPVGRGVLAEPYRWAELEQLVFSPSRWERRLVGSTIATIPFIDRTAGRRPEVAAHGLKLLAQLIGEDQPDVQKALAWAYRSMAAVDRPATTAALDGEAATAAATGDGYRAWVIRDALPKLDLDDAIRIRAGLDGLRRRPGAPATSPAAATAARFSTLPLGQPTPEPPLT
ncbi:MAG: DNA alkylation repair protein [Chloroflexi bacterium]|nr:DNA alkylation repair protein [Chloroflexota bacterium]